MKLRLTTKSTTDNLGQEIPYLVIMGFSHEECLYSWMSLFFGTATHSLTKCRQVRQLALWRWLRKGHSLCLWMRGFFYTSGNIWLKRKTQDDKLRSIFLWFPYEFALQRHVLTDNSLVFRQQQGSHVRKLGRPENVDWLRWWWAMKRKYAIPFLL